MYVGRHRGHHPRQVSSTGQDILAFVRAVQHLRVMAIIVSVTMQGRALEPRCRNVRRRPWYCQMPLGNYGVARPRETEPTSLLTAWLSESSMCRM